MIEGLRAIARERASHERESILYEFAFDSAKVADAFLVEEGCKTSADVFMEKASDLHDISDEEMDALIDRIPETDDDITDIEIDRIVNSEDEIGIDDMLGIEEGCKDN